MKVKRRKAALWVSVVCVLGLVCGLAACAPNAEKAGRADQKATDKPIAQKVESVPETDSFGVVDADAWKDYYLTNTKLMSKTTRTALRAKSTIICSCIQRSTLCIKGTLLPWDTTGARTHACA